MSYKISKELFEAVMDLVPKGNTFRLENKGMYYAKNYYTYNDFYFKCKEWALKQGYIIKLEHHYFNSHRIVLFKRGENSYTEPWKCVFQTEFEAVVKACEWLLNNKDKE